ncbi:MAG: S41 family peptidase [Gemmatimonadetes bacterium]|nr:S41 family peptidase [Gemmatimonadota bacterium]
MSNHAPARVTTLLLVALLSLAPQAASPGLGQSTPPPSTTDTQAIPQTNSLEVQVLLGVVEAVRRQALTELSDSAVWELAIQGMIKELNDPYAQILSADEYGAFEESATGNYAGIGIQIQQLNNTITVTGVFRGTPADSAGLLVGDRIVEVEGQSALGWTTSQAADRIRGERGTPVSIMIQRDGIDLPIPHTIRRDEVHYSSVTATTFADSLGYVRLDRVARGSMMEVDSALQRLQHVKGLVLDLRHNPGGYLDEGLGVADLFLPRNIPVASLRGRGPEDRNVFRSRRLPRMPDIPIVVLVDDFSASAAEIIAGALQDNDRALVVGDRTFGKGSVQTLIPLPQGRWLRLTTASWYTPLGRSLTRYRDKEGSLLPEVPDTVSYMTSQGRKIPGGGGILPDVVVTDDTLRTAERAVWNTANAARMPLTARGAEFAFQQARQAGNAPNAVIPNSAFDDFVNRLVRDGIPADVLRNDVARRYLRWDVEVQFYERLGQPGRALQLRAERDLPLAEAIRRLRGARTQSDLFAAMAAPTPSPN